MGTDVHVIVHGDPALAELAQAEVERLEQLWSRFLPASEVSALNRSAGTWVSVSPETIQLVERAIAAHAVTEGRFDPTVLGDVIRAGYDQSFEVLREQGDRQDLPTSTLARGVDGIAVDTPGGRVRLAAGTGFDPGGLGKGLAADLVATRIDREGAAGALINIGGDLRAVGVGPAGDDWSVVLDPAAAGEPIATVVLDRGAVATSTVLRRHWTVAGRHAHHLIDPETGEPSQSDVVSASVLARRGWQAEVLAKAAVVAGVTDALALIERTGADAILVDRNGDLHTTNGFGRFALAASQPEGVAS